MDVKLKVESDVKNDNSYFTRWIDKTISLLKNDNTFMENLNEWYKVSPEPAKPQVAKIIKLFNDN